MKLTKIGQRGKLAELQRKLCTMLEAPQDRTELPIKAPAVKAAVHGKSKDGNTAVQQVVGKEHWTYVVLIRM